MRIALVHSFYRSDVPSGENIAVEQQLDALENAGHTVGLIARHTDRLRAAHTYGIAAATRVATGRGASPTRELEAFRPDVVHVHNLFPNYGRAWLRQSPWPTVATLHNYRPLCAAGTLFRNGSTCTSCLDAGHAAPAVFHGCYRGSRAATIPIAIGTRFGNDPVLSAAHRLIVLSETMKEVYASAGVDPQRMAVVPNFVPPPLTVPPLPGPDPYFIYVGRLSQEKGVLELLRAWPDGHRLIVVGDGPLADEVSYFQSDQVQVLGPQPKERTRQLIAGAVGLLFPSLWHEGFPLVYIEAISAGTPVVATGPSVVGQLVEDDGTGVTVQLTDLPEVIASATREFPLIRSRCRDAFALKYSREAWLERVLATYYSAREAHTVAR